jgi:hypothetical protein
MEAAEGTGERTRALVASFAAGVASRNAFRRPDVQYIAAGVRLRGLRAYYNDCSEVNRKSCVMDQELS